jgi:hypothetical protein
MPVAKPSDTVAGWRAIVDSHPCEGVAESIAMRAGGLMFQHRINLDEKRLRNFVETEPALSETAASLSAKLGVNRRLARRVLDRYVEIGVVQRRTFGARIEPVYYRYSARAS